MHNKLPDDFFKTQLKWKKIPVLVTNNFSLFNIVLSLYHTIPTFNDLENETF